MVVNIIFFITMYPIMFIMYIVMRNLGDGKNGYSFGVRMQPEWMRDEGVQRIVAEYKKKLKRFAIIFAIVPLSAFVIPSMSISFTIWLSWLLAVIAVPMIPYVRANAQVQLKKREMGWTQGNDGYTFTDLESAKSGVHCVKFLTFLPPLLISIAAGSWGLWQAWRQSMEPLGIMAVTFALLTMVFYGAAVWMDRQKNEVISRDSNVNINYNRAKKNLWKNIWLLEAWMNAVFTVLVTVTLAFEEFQVGNILAESVLYAILGCIPLLLAAKKLHEIDVHYAAFRDMPEGEHDGDEYWLGGLFYYNKNDTHTMVTKRAGIGTTMNLATPVGFWFTVFGLLTLLVIPISCVWLMLEEFTPIRLTVENEVLVAEHLRVEYEIPLSEMTSVELIDEYPTWSKSNGTGMDNLLKGTFHIRNVGNCEVLMDPRNGVFLKIQTADEVYYMSAPDDDGTRTLYEELIN